MVLHSRLDYRYVEENGNRKGPWRSEVFEKARRDWDGHPDDNPRGDRLGTEDNPGEGYEDVDDLGGTYGDRDTPNAPNDRYLNGGCRYEMSDTPGFDEVFDIVGRADFGWTIEFLVDISFLVSIVDTCDEERKDKPVQAEVFTIFGQSVVQKKDVLKLQKSLD
jgi:hypothetical protein